MRAALKLGDEMDIHHVPDKRHSAAGILSYDEETAPVVVLRKREHRKLSHG